MKSVLTGLGFKGSLSWVHNEEGSGAKIYKSSAYYPDSRTAPKTTSGVTIDPGLDLGHADINIIKDTVEYYLGKGVLSQTQATLLSFAIGKRMFEAIQWMKANEKYFKNQFLVKDEFAIYIMDKVTAPPYWAPLTKSIPQLLNLKGYMAEAIHTALLSMSYNRGPVRTITLAKDFILKKDYEGLAAAITAVKSPTASLRNRRIRESNLITAALEAEENTRITIDANLIPEPLPVYFPERDRIFEMDYIPVPEKPKI